MWKSWGEQSKKQGGEAKDGKVTSPPGGASGQRGGEMNKERVSAGFLDIKVRAAARRGLAAQKYALQRFRQLEWASELG